MVLSANGGVELHDAPQGGLHDVQPALRLGVGLRRQERQLDRHIGRLDAGNGVGSEHRDRIGVPRTERNRLVRQGVRVGRFYRQHDRQLRLVE